MASQYSRTYLDHSGENSTLQMWLRQITAANFDAVSAEITALAGSVDALSDGTVVRVRTMSNSLALPNVAPALATAQREMKWRVDFVDETNGKHGSFEIPIAKQSLAGSQDRVADITVAPWAAFVTAAETVGRTIDGNTFAITAITMVGRNL